MNEFEFIITIIIIIIIIIYIYIYFFFLHISLQIPLLKRVESKRKAHWQHPLPFSFSRRVGFSITYHDFISPLFQAPSCFFFFSVWFISERTCFSGHVLAFFFFSFTGGLRIILLHVFPTFFFLFRLFHTCVLFFFLAITHTQKKKKRTFKMLDTERR